MSGPSRRPEIRRRRHRAAKIALLRKRYRNAPSEVERNRLLEKLRKIVPGLTPESLAHLAEKKV